MVNEGQINISIGECSNMSNAIENLLEVKGTE